MSVELEQLVAAELEREVVEESSLSHSLGLPLKKRSGVVAGEL